MAKFFTIPGIWTGGEIELAIGIGLRSNMRLLTVLNPILTHSNGEGYYLHRDREPTEQDRLILETSSFDGGLSALFGTAPFMDKPHFPFRVSLVRFVDGEDWVSFGFSMAALATVYPVGGFPFDDGSSLEWLPKVMEPLRHLGESIYLSVQYRLALIGWEVLAETSAEKFSSKGIPERRWMGYLIPEGPQLTWYSPNL